MQTDGQKNHRHALSSAIASVANKVTLPASKEDIFQRVRISAGRMSAWQAMTIAAAKEANGNDCKSGVKNNKAPITTAALATDDHAV